MNNNVIYEIYTHLSYQEFKHLGLLNKSLNLYCKNTKIFNKILMIKYVNYLIENDNLPVLLDGIISPNKQLILETFLKEPNNSIANICLRTGMVLSLLMYLITNKKK